MSFVFALYDQQFREMSEVVYVGVLTQGMIRTRPPHPLSLY